jgi:hypothetical protein
MLKNLKAAFVNRFGAAVNTQEHRQRVWQSWYTQFDDNPFGVRPAEISHQTYLDLAAEVQGRAYPAFLEAVDAEFGFLPEKAFVDELALTTQVVVKNSHCFTCMAICSTARCGIICMRIPSCGR